MNGGQKILVLYQVTNSLGDSGQYNAFEMPRVKGGIKLSTVKKYSLALRKINKAGPDGYQWRVRVDDKVSSSNNGAKRMQCYSWWDIQDENAPLPVKEATFAELNQILTPRKKTVVEPEDSVTKAASGAIRSLGKAMNKVAATVEASTSSADEYPRVPILVLKLLDLTKIYDSFSQKSQRRSSDNEQYESKHSRNVPRGSTGQSTTMHPQTHKSRPTPTTRPGSQVSNKPTPSRQVPTTQSAPRNSSKSTTTAASLMDFGESVTQAPSKFGGGANNLTRAEKLKREYEKKKQTENRVWDEIDQRWVTVDSRRGQKSGKALGTSTATTTLPQKMKGISLGATNTAGKSAHVAAAVQSRVNEMKSAQQKALNEIREREMKKKQSDAAEDQVRQRLEPLIKKWSEEHGKKKQLRALLASLHTVLWPGTKWKPVNLGDILDDRKCRISFHKASRVVHPDKTMELNAEQRFLAKRIFDALSQAKAVSGI